MKGSTAALPRKLPGRLRDAPVSRVLPGRNRTKADISVRLLDGRPYAVKDYAPRGWLVRQLLGRYLVGRECRAYRAAGALDDLAAFVGRVDRFALATEWLEGRPLNTFAPGEPPATLFDRLAVLLDQLHRRGIALADLHRRDVVVGDDGRVAVVDLASAWIVGAAPTGLRRRLFEQLCRQDRISLARMRAHFEGRPEHDALADNDPAAVKRYRRARALKAWFDRARGRRR